MLYLILFVLFLIFIPHSAYAWGPGVHIGVSISILDRINVQTASMLAANLNEYLYGALAPDFIVGKKYAQDNRHSHNWNVGFDILNSAKTDSQRAFGYGYLTHLAADSAAHGIMIPKIVDRYESHKNARHFYIEAVADTFCDKPYKHLAKKILNRYNKKLDKQFKFKVDSVLFSFSISKAIFKNMTRLTLNKQFDSIILSRYMSHFMSFQMELIRSYIDLSKEFSIDVVEKKEKSKVVKISAISR